MGLPAPACVPKCGDSRRQRARPAVELVIAAVPPYAPTLRAEAWWQAEDHCIMNACPGTQVPAQPSLTVGLP